MAKGSNIVHEYFRKEIEGLTILVRVNPIHYTGTEITLQDGVAEMREMEFDEEILEDLKVDGFTASSALEFNLYLNGLV
ncbi:hypothetical protein [Parachryseolinea silvisoli]|jgi:hypothetical protein|uniref:hypothetical protein n=1 Tax=Parachryseolinea silvisoli TaxID=2873601 RepID=UPI002265D28D|nr:hypothetical protein [Parachryseolinea silvisoli]MCD9014481.1 hypothetical protein [Parachryseolinea silvisoli]